MRRPILISLLFVLVSCNSTIQNKKEMEENTSKNTVSANDTVPKVVGIGGIFFFSDDPQETRNWYSKNLGLDINEWGATFESRKINDPDEVESLQWSPFKKGDEYFSPSKKDFMINYRVQNIEGLVKKLRENGVHILDTIATYDYGKFIHIMDAEGNKIELWEPVRAQSAK